MADPAFPPPAAPPASCSQNGSAAWWEDLSPVTWVPCPHAPLPPLYGESSSSGAHFAFSLQGQSPLLLFDSQIRITQEKRLLFLQI